MKRALDALAGIAQAYQGLQKLGQVLGTDSELEGAKNPAAKGKTNDGGMTVKTHRVHSIEQRVGFIVHMIQKGRDHPVVRKFATAAVSRKCTKGWCIEEGDYDNEIRAVFDATRENVRYVRDTFNKDLFQHPARTLEFKAADCDDFASLLAAALGSIGYPMRLRVIRTKEADDWNHIYALVGLPPRAPKRWVPLDASVPKPAGWEPPRSMVADRRDFEVP